MSFRDLYITLSTALLLTPVLFVSLGFVSAQVMQSSSYRIQSDSINFGGGAGTSTSYTLESTAGEVATGDSSSASYLLKAGYQQMVTNFISMSAAPPVTLLPSIPGVSGGTANGSTTVTVITDSPAGYQLLIASTESPAMKKGADSIADYIPVGAPDFNFITNTTDSHFGYSPAGVDVVNRFRDNGGACNIGSLETAFSCWDGLDIVNEPIAHGTSANTPSGATTTVNFRVGVGGSVVQAVGTYTATTTLTAISL